LQDHSHQGVGSKILQAVEKWALEQSINRLESQVAQSNAIAVAFYAKHGYQQEGLAKQAIRVANTYYDSCLMGKILAEG
jgi:RimJ/RimL family protein N-acetyltransferase